MLFPDIADGCQHKVTRSRRIILLEDDAAHDEDFGSQAIPTGLQQWIPQLDDDENDIRGEENLYNFHGDGNDYIALDLGQSEQEETFARREEQSPRRSNHEYVIPESQEGDVGWRGKPNFF